MSGNQINISVLHVVGAMNRGGAETFLMNTLRNIDKDRFTFVFLCYGNNKFDYEDEIISLGSKIVRIPDVKVVGILRHIRDIKQVIQNENIHMVHVHTHYNSMFSVIAARLAKLKVRIVHSHTTESGSDQGIIRRIYSVVAKIMININTTNYVACSTGAGRALFGNRKKIQIIHNGIDVSKFRYSKNIRRLMREQLRISDDTFVIGHIGRF